MAGIRKRIFSAIPAGYKVVLSKNTYTDPCPVCGGVIVKEAYLGGRFTIARIASPLK